MPPPSSGLKTQNPIDVSSFSGISFNIKVGSGTAPPLWFELFNTQTEPAPDGVATNNGVDEYNTRGKLLANLSDELDDHLRSFRNVGAALSAGVNIVELRDRNGPLPGAGLGSDDHARAPVLGLSAVFRLDV